MTDSELKLNQLRSRQAFPLPMKERFTLNRIRAWHEHHDGMVYIALSGGKDSCVGADLVWSIYPDTPAVFVDTGCELESVNRHVQKLIDQGKPITIVKPETDFWSIVDEHGWPILSKQICMGINRFVRTKSFTQKKLRAFGGINPTSGKKQQRTIPKKWHYILKAVLRGEIKVTSKCCSELKIKPFTKYENETGRVPFIFTMADESRSRELGYLRSGGCNGFKQGRKGESRPMSFWTEQDVLRYCKEKLEIADCYGEIVEGQNGKFETTGEKRTGCKWCGFGAHCEKGENRIQRLARTEPESYAEFLAHGGGEVMDLIGVEWRV